MIEIDTIIEDNGNLVAKLNKWPVEFNDTVIQELLRIANDMRNYIIKEMKNSPPDYSKKLIRQGTRYKVNAKNRKYHYSSYKGNFPRIDSGRLVGSINVEKLPDGVGVGSVINGKEVINYAKYLEDENKLNRPFLKPTLKHFEPTIEKRLMRAIRDRARK